MKRAIPWLLLLVACSKPAPPAAETPVEDEVTPPWRSGGRAISTRACQSGLCADGVCVQDGFCRG